MKTAELLPATKFLYNVRSHAFHEVPDDTTFALFAVQNNLEGVDVPLPRRLFGPVKTTDLPVARVMQQLRDAAWVRMALINRGKLVIDAANLLFAYAALNRFIGRYTSTAFDTLQIDADGEFYNVTDKLKILQFANMAVKNPLKVVDDASGAANQLPS